MIGFVLLFPMVFFSTVMTGFTAMLIAFSLFHSFHNSHDTNVLMSLCQSVYGAQ
jgi:hypothetical protein